MEVISSVRHKQKQGVEVEVKTANIDKGHEKELHKNDETVDINKSADNVPENPTVSASACITAAHPWASTKPSSSTESRTSSSFDPGNKCHENNETVDV